MAGSGGRGLAAPRAGAPRWEPGQGPEGAAAWGEQAVGSQRAGIASRPWPSRWPLFTTSSLLGPLLWFQASPLVQAACRGEGEGTVPGTAAKAPREPGDLKGRKTRVVRDSGTPGQAGGGRAALSESKPLGSWGALSQLAQRTGGLGPGAEGAAGAPGEDSRAGSLCTCHHSPGLQRPAAASAGLEDSGPRGPAACHG